ncbi:hypothetical protein, partial [uncultured Dialister sp.]|uniref:hypothetical protein n=1 Tax=uncultured Dialister sp. TaxID=278064 RepID=UPI0025972DC2
FFFFYFIGCFFIFLFFFFTSYLFVFFVLFFVLFSSPCLGILFSLDSLMEVIAAMVNVFVPMFGDSFFTAGLGCPTGWALYGPFAAGISN